jgi:hypothetical protein
VIKAGESALNLQVRRDENPRVKTQSVVRVVTAQAESALTGVASGRTGVRAIAVVPLRAPAGRRSNFPSVFLLEPPGN